MSAAWQRWFAWRPVRLASTGGRAWLRHVRRRLDASHEVSPPEGAARLLALPLFVSGEAVTYERAQHLARRLAEHLADAGMDLCSEGSAERVRSWADSPAGAEVGTETLMAHLTYAARAQSRETEFYPCWIYEEEEPRK